MSLDLLTAPPTRDTLLDWVCWLDRTLGNEDDDTSLYTQMLARSFLAIGHAFYEYVTTQPIVDTIEALEDYVLNPTEGLYQVYVSKATQSYGFGSGDGCFSIPELQARGYAGCSPGSGCSSGAGGLVGLAMQFDSAEVMQIIQRDITAWLNNDPDPVEQHILLR